MTQKQNDLFTKLINAYTFDSPQLVPEKWRAYIYEKLKDKYIHFTPVVIETEDDEIKDNFEKYVQANQKYKY